MKTTRRDTDEVRSKQTPDARSDLAVLLARDERAARATRPSVDGFAASLHASDVQLSALDAALIQFRQSVQARSDGEVHALAAHGASGAGSQLPHLDQIQRSFGRHDVSKVKAHTGARANEANQGMGARAYASGDNVVLGDNGRDLHTVAHEAAHVVQQRGGVSLKGGVGQVGDAYERHADAVADKVVAGESAEGLLDQYAGTGASSLAPGVQKKAPGFGMSAGVDENGNFSKSYGLSYPMPTVFVPLYPTGAPNFKGAAGLYLTLDGAIGGSVSMGTADGSKVAIAGQANVDLAVNAGGSLKLGDKPFTIAAYGGASMAAKLERGVSRDKGFGGGFTLTSSLFIGVKVGFAKFQWTFGSRDLLTGEYKGVLKGLNEKKGGESKAALPGEGASVGPAVQQNADPAASQASGGGGGDNEASIEELTFHAAPGLEGIAETVISVIKAASEVMEEAQEAAYDGYAAAGSVFFGIEDPREVKKRIAAEIKGLNAHHDKAGNLRDQWIAKGASYTSANNIAACWHNSRSIWERLAWTNRQTKEMAKTEALIAKGNKVAEKKRKELVARGVGEDEAAYVADLFADAAKHPGYAIDWTANGQAPDPDTDFSNEVERLQRFAQEAQDGVVGRVERANARDEAAKSREHARANALD